VLVVLLLRHTVTYLLSSIKQVIQFKSLVKNLVLLFINRGDVNKYIMVHTIVKGNECYIFMNGKLIHKTRINNSESGVTFDVMAYRKNDSLKSIKL
jgi:hypothetical protein